MTRILDLARLSFTDALRRDGQPVRVAFTGETLSDGGVVETEEPDDESRTVHFVEGTPSIIGERAVVEGVLLVRHHKATTPDGITFPECVEVMVVSARLVR